MSLKFICFFLLLGSIAISQENSPEREGFWVVRYALRSPEDIDQIIHTAFTTGITDLFIQVRALGETYYKSRIESKSLMIPENFDPLAYAIEKAQLL